MFGVNVWVVTENLPLDLGSEVVEFLKILLPLVPIGQIGIPPVFHHLGKLLGIEAIFKADSFQGLLGFQGAA